MKPSDGVFIKTYELTIHQYNVLMPVLLRPRMYVGDGPDDYASIALAWFINGYLAAIQGFGVDSLFCQSPCVANTSRSLEENAKKFIEMLKPKGA